MTKNFNDGKLGVKRFIIRFCPFGMFSRQLQTNTGRSLK